MFHFFTLLSWYFFTLSLFPYFWRLHMFDRCFWMISVQFFSTMYTLTLFVRIVLPFFFEFAHLSFFHPLTTIYTFYIFFYRCTSNSHFFYNCFSNLHFFLHLFFPFTFFVTLFILARLTVFLQLYFQLTLFLHFFFYTFFTLFFTVVFPIHTFFTLFFLHFFHTFFYSCISNLHFYTFFFTLVLHFFCTKTVKKSVENIVKWTKKRSKV